MNRIILFLDNIKRYLRPGGDFAGARPFKNSVNYRMCLKCDHVFEIDGHISSHDIELLTKLFTANGFEIFHLDNFNLWHAVSNVFILREVYRYFYYYLLKNRTNDQLEYIVKPLI